MTREQQISLLKVVIQDEYIAEALQDNDVKEAVIELCCKSPREIKAIYEEAGFSFTEREGQHNVSEIVALLGEVLKLPLSQLPLVKNIPELYYIYTTYPSEPRPVYKEATTNKIAQLENFHSNSWWKDFMLSKRIIRTRLSSEIRNKNLADFQICVANAKNNPPELGKIDTSDAVLLAVGKVDDVVVFVDLDDLDAPVQYRS